MTPINWAVYRICNIDVALAQSGFFIYKKRRTQHKVFEVPLDLSASLYKIFELSQTY